MLYEFLDTLVEVIGDWLWLALRWLLASACLCGLGAGAFFGWRMLFECLRQAGCTR